MVRAWYMDDSPSDQRLPHMTDPPRFVSLEQLRKLTGIEYFKINVDDFNNDETLQRIRKERGYSYEDSLCLRSDLPDYESKIKRFFEEHLHSDEEIRLVIDGTGYFDARDTNDQWIRVKMIKGDMIILPAGIYHRFTLDTTNYIKANRYFIGEPVWTAHNRSETTDKMVVRQEYEGSLAKLQGS